MNAGAFVSETKKGDTLTVSIKKEDYEKKLIKTKPLDFFDKSIYNSDIGVFSLSNKGKTYLSVAHYESELLENQDIGYYIFGGIGIFLLLFGIYAIINSRSL